MATNHLPHIKRHLLAISLIASIVLSSGTSTSAKNNVTVDTQPITDEAAPDSSQKPFEDVDIGSSYYVQLKFLKEQNLIKGYEDNTFRPKNLINRAEAAMAMSKVLLNFETQDLEEEMDYTDLSKDHWAHNSVQQLTTLKIVGGYGKKGKTEKTFKPEKNINLAEAVKMVIGIEMLKDKELALPSSMKSSFKDVAGTEWFAPYIELAQQKTLLSYTTKMLIRPDSEMTRGEFMDLLYRALKTREPGYFFGRGTFYSDFFEGRGTANDEIYTQNGYTAAHLTLPFNTKLEVTYLRNGQSVRVRVNDRGPFTPSMNLDLTRKAFTQLANPSEGIIPIAYRIVTD